MSSNPFGKKRLSDIVDPAMSQSQVEEPFHDPTTDHAVPVDYVNKPDEADIIPWDDIPTPEPTNRTSNEQMAELVGSVEEDTLFSNVYAERKEPVEDRTTKPVSIQYMDSTKPIETFDVDIANTEEDEEEATAGEESIAVPVKLISTSLGELPIDATAIVAPQIFEEVEAVQSATVSVTASMPDTSHLLVVDKKEPEQILEEVSVSEVFAPEAVLETTKQKLFKHIDVPVEEERVVANDTTDEDITDETDNIQIVSVDTPYKDLVVKFRDVADAISKKYNLDTEEGAEAFAKELDNENGLAYKLRSLLGVASAYRDFENKAFQQHDPEQLNIITSNIRPKNTSSKINYQNDKDPTKTLTDDEARKFLFAKVRGSKKVFLTSSGFYVYVRPLTNLEISEYVSTISNESRNYGRQLGGHFYLFNSMHIKQFFADKLMSIVSECNLQGWRQGSTLADNISLQDYKTILWACACGMYKDGVKFTKICSFCGHEEEILMNIDKLFFQNEHPLLEGALKIIEGKKNITTKDAAAYRAAIAYNTNNVIKIPGFEVELRVPTLTNYFNYAVSFINTMVSEIRDLNDEEAVKDYIRYTFYKQYAPWVSAIRSVDEDGNLEGRMVTEGAITDFFKLVSFEDTTFGKEMEEYIMSTMLTYIAFPYIECPSCHKVPEDIVNGFVSYDIESGFFTMSVKKLRELNSKITD